MDKKDLVVKGADGLSLARTDSLLAITNKLLAGRGNHQGLVESDAWLDELIAWADENNIEDYYFDEDYCRWRGFPRDKQKILALTELDLWGNNLNQIPASIGNLHNLTVLILMDNNLSEIPDSIGNLHNLTELRLDDNNLNNIPDSIGNLRNLTELYLSSTELNEIPEGIGKLHNLTKLYLSSIRLNEIPEFIGKLHNLTELYLEDNELSLLPKSIVNLTNLKYLYLKKDLIYLYLNNNQDLELTIEQKQWLIELKNNGCKIEIDNFEEIFANQKITKSDNENIENCQWKFSYQCPKQWDNLTPTEDDSIRFCSTCKQNVYACYDDNAVKEHTKRQHCVAIINESNYETIGLIDFGDEEYVFDKESNSDSFSDGEFDLSAFEDSEFDDDVPF